MAQVLDPIPMSRKTSEARPFDFAQGRLSSAAIQVPTPTGFSR